jgi:hypothetical protein
MPNELLTEDGFLILADISGFTAFVTATELEHGAQVTGLLLETVMERLSPPLEIQELEGDAVFALGPDRLVADGSTVPTLLGDAVVAFTERRRQLASEPGCQCGACRETARLNLKVIAHYGRFVRQLVGGRPRVTGPHVILAHRLLKNSVAAGTYLLLTEPAVERTGLDPGAGRMGRRLMSYPHFGEVPCFVADLGSLAPPGRAIAAVGMA